MTASEGMTVEELLALPAVVNLETAGKAWRLSHSTAAELARSEEFPCRVLQIGKRYKVRKVDLLQSLGLNMDGTPLAA